MPPTALAVAAGAKSGDEGVAALSKLMYVSAIRADVRMTPVNYLAAGSPVVIRRATGRSGNFEL